jgi:hypothetical protein
MKKKERKKYGILPPKIAESDTVSLDHGLYGSGGFIYNKDTIQCTLSVFLLALTITYNDRFSNISQVGLILSKPKISQQHPSRVCFIILG